MYPLDRGRKAMPCAPVRRIAIQSLALVLVLTLVGPAVAAHRTRGRAPGLDNPALRDGGPTYLPGVVIVKFAERQALGIHGEPQLAPRIQSLLDAHRVTRVTPLLRGGDLEAPNGAPTGKAHAGGPDLSRVFVLRFESAADAKAVARDLAASWDVEYAEPQFVYALAEAAPTLPRIHLPAMAPNDSLYSADQSTYYDRMDLPEAFVDTRGDMGSVVVAIVDGGTEWQHPDLIGNVWTNPGETANGIDDDGNGYVDDLHGWNFANGTNDATGLPQTPGSAAHGTHVAGIACASTNNTAGVAGASWNAKFMPICVSHPALDHAISAGYAGILYAAQNGADIINCSWGGATNPSNFEQEVIDFARAQGAVVVAAAGNNANMIPFYPAAYEHVMSVANLAQNDVKIFSSNYGPWVDISATGTDILSTSSNAGYAVMNGTSMASPHAAAACALVKTKFPAYTPDQVAERVRVTSDNIYNINPSYAGELGYGRVNAYQALTKATPAIRVHDVTVVTTDGDAIIEPGETATLTVTVKNHLDAATGGSFTLSEDSGFATMSVDGAVLASIGANQTAVLSSFVVDIDPGAPVNHAIEFTLDIGTTTPAYVDADRFGLRVLPIVATHAANNVVTSITSVGRLGFAEVSGGNGNDGVGFLYGGSSNLLFEGALIVGTGSDALSNAARGAPNPNVMDNDFSTAVDGVPVITDAHLGMAEFGSAAFADADASPSLGLHVEQESWQLDEAPFDDLIVLKHTIRNDGVSTLTDLYVGWFLDWDLDGTSYLTNQAGYDAGRGLGYVWDATGTGPSDYVGVMTLSAPGTTSYRGIWNDETDPSNPSWGLYDGYTDVEKWQSISGGITQTNVGPGDVSQAIGTGPFTLAPGADVTVGFAILGGTDLADLQSNADAAQLLWDAPVDADRGAGARLPRHVRLAPNVPNPFNPVTHIAFELPRDAEVELHVYNVAGQRVRTLAQQRFVAGVHSLTWNGTNDRGEGLPSGTYFYRIHVEGHSVTRKMQLLK